MKKLLIVNLIVAGLLLACFWTFAFFVYGVFVNPVGLALGITCGCFALLPLLLSVLVLFVVDIYCVFGFWPKHKLVTLLPFVVLGVAVMSMRAWDIRAMSIRRFEKHLPDYEAFVAMAKKEHKPGDWDVMGMPKEYRHLGYLAIIYDDKPILENEPNTLVVSIEVGHFGIFGHTHFLYSSNGEIARGSKAAREWPRRQRVKEHWFRVGD
jgi:hypothetical protein